MAKNFQKAERNIKIDGEYKLLSYASSSESVEMTDGTDLQSKMDSVDENIVAETNRATNAENTLTTNLQAEIDRATAEETTIKNSVYNKNEIDNKFSTLETNIDWKEAVDTFDDIATTYPSPEDGWTVNVKDTDYTYRYNGTEWVAISANAIPKATQLVDGLITKEDKKKLDGISTGAEVNQNAFSNISVGSTTLSADTTTDTFALEAGSNVEITPDETTNALTISSSHETISTTEDTTSSISPRAGETFEVIDGVVRDANGHITTVNIKTVRLPETSVVVDNALSNTSANPVQNKVITNEISELGSILGKEISEYDSAKKYGANDIVVYNGKLYRSTRSIGVSLAPVTGDFNPDYWEEVNSIELLQRLHLAENIYTDFKVDYTGMSSLGGAYDSINAATKSIYDKTKELNTTVGATDIHGIGDGTLTGGLSALNTNLANANMLVMLDDTGYFPENVGDTVTHVLTQDISHYKEMLFLCNIGDSCREIRVPIALSGVRLGQSYYITDGYTGALDIVFNWSNKKLEIYLRSRVGFSRSRFGVTQIFGVR